MIGGSMLLVAAAAVALVAGLLTGGLALIWVSIGLCLLAGLLLLVGVLRLRVRSAQAPPFEDAHEPPGAAGWGDTDRRSPPEV